MEYDPIKKSAGRFVSDSVFLRKVFYFALDILLLRAWHVRKAFKRIALRYPGPSCMLDAGAGFGQYTWRMCRLNSHWKIKAVDIDDEHVRDLRMFFSKTGLSDRISCEKVDLTELNEPEKYDFILSVDVMEHIEKDEIVFSNFFRALKPGGTLLISTPSDMGGSDVKKKNDKSFIDEHVRDGYSVGDLTVKLKKAGFRYIRSYYTYGKPGSFSWLLSMKYPMALLKTSELLFLFLPFYYLIMLPLILILNYFDILLTHKTGTGLLVVANN